MGTSTAAASTTTTTATTAAAVSTFSTSSSTFCSSWSSFWNILSGLQGQRQVYHFMINLIMCTCIISLKFNYQPACRRTPIFFSLNDDFNNFILVLYRLLYT